MKKKVIRKVINSHGLTVGVKHEYRTLCQKKSVENIQEVLKEKQKYINLKNDVLPFLTKKHAYILKNYMCGYSNETITDLQKRFGYKNQSTTYRIIEKILKEIDGIIKGKKEVEKFTNLLGGENGIEDIKLFFDDAELELFDHVVMSPHQKAHLVYAEDYGIDSQEILKEKGKLLTKIFDILERKNECQNFIENNGGEDFLINEFGPCLSEKQFDILANFMMDYHYSNYYNASLAMGEPFNYISIMKNLILTHLEAYNARKAEVAKMFEDAGGEKRVFEKLYLELDDDEKVVFENRFLAYEQPTYSEIAKKLGKSVDYVNKHTRIIKQKIEELKETAANQKQN